MTPRPRKLTGLGEKNRPSAAGSVDVDCAGLVGPATPLGTSATGRIGSARRVIAEQSRRTPMKIVRDMCTVVPAVLVTATAVIGVAAVIGLSSWALL
jgi:hypothetical protein